MKKLILTIVLFSILILLKAQDRPLVQIITTAGGRISTAASNVYNLSNLTKPIVISSSVRGGRINSSKAPGSKLIFSQELPPNEARILLMLALTKSNESEDIQAIFDKY